MSTRSKLGNLLVISGGATIAIGLVLAAVLGEPLLLIAVAVGLSDVGLGFLFGAGKLSGSPASDVLDPASADENPYARAD